MESDRTGSGVYATRLFYVEAGFYAVFFGFMVAAIAVAAW